MVQKVTHWLGDNTRQQRQDKTHPEWAANLPCRLSFRLTSRIPTEEKDNDYSYTYSDLWINVLSKQ